MCCWAELTIFVSVSGECGGWKSLRRSAWALDAVASRPKARMGTRTRYLVRRDMAQTMSRSPAPVKAPGQTDAAAGEVRSGVGWREEELRGNHAPARRNLRR